MNASGRRPSPPPPGRGVRTTRRGPLFRALPLLLITAGVVASVLAAAPLRGVAAAAAGGDRTGGGSATTAIGDGSVADAADPGWTARDVPLGVAASPTGTTPSPAPGKLLLVVVLCRHGARSPLYTFPGDVRPLDAWGVGAGGLTAAGTAAHYELGTRLRSRYIDSGFLSRTFNASEVYVRSTAIDRALLSAYAQMAGLYATAADEQEPAAVDAALPPTLHPVPIHSVAAATDTMLLSGVACPRVAALRRARDSSTATSATAVRHEHLLSVTLPRVLQLPPGVKMDLPSVAAVNDVWTASAAAGLPYPKGVSAADVADVRAIANGLLAASVAGAEVQRLRSGVLLRALRDRAVAAAAAHAGQLPPPLAGTDGSENRGHGHAETPVAGAARFAPHPPLSSPRYVLYSAHDTTLAAALAALGAFDGTNPPYNSTVVLELRASPAAVTAASSKEGRRPTPADYSVRVEYNGVPVRVRGCGGAVDCPLPTWVAGTASRVLDTDAERVAACATGVRRIAMALGSMVGIGPTAAWPAEGGKEGEAHPDSVVVLDGHDGWRRVALPLAGNMDGGGALRATLRLVAMGAGGCLLVATALALVRRHKASATYGPIGERGSTY
ncbi:hypothetical protein MMPV_004546 [Pyropia vietnamensis]